jgi:hypothetical protein
MASASGSGLPKRGSCSFFSFGALESLASSDIDGTGENGGGRRVGVTRPSAPLLCMRTAGITNTTEGHPCIDAWVVWTHTPAPTRAHQPRGPKTAAGSPAAHSARLVWRTPSEMSRGCIIPASSRRFARARDANIHWPAHNLGRAGYRALPPWPRTARCAHPGLRATVRAHSRRRCTPIVDHGGSSHRFDWLAGRQKTASDRSLDSPASESCTASESCVRTSVQLSYSLPNNPNMYSSTKMTPEL